MKIIVQPQVPVPFAPDTQRGLAMRDQESGTPVTLVELYAALARKMLEARKFDFRFMPAICEEFVKLADEARIRKVVGPSAADNVEVVA